MNFKKISFIICLMSFIILNLTVVIATNRNNYNISTFFRIHVVANSNSFDDQIIKLKVSKAVESYISDITKYSKTKDQSKNIIKENIARYYVRC